MSDKVTYSFDEQMATLTIDDGKANALSQDVFDELNRVLDQADADEAGGVIITGRPGTFSAGFDLNALRAGGVGAVEMMISGFRLSERLLAHPRPVVIAAGGHAIAMGAFLCLSSDYRVGADGAFRVGVNEVAIGLTMPRFGVEVCRHRLTPAYFNRAVTGGEFFSPAEAVSAGFFDAIVEPSEVETAARIAATRLANLPREAFAGTKARTHEEVLNAVRAAIEADEREFRSWL